MPASVAEMNRARALDVCTWLVFLLSSALMVLAAQGDLWLDEIWSLSFARDAESVSDLFLIFQHDNSHVLNTLFLHLLGEPDPPAASRLLSIASGVGSLLLTGWVARRDWGDVEAFCATILVGSSYPLLLYFSEARGYAPAILLALSAYATMQPGPARCGRKRYVLFWVISALGVLAHASFVMMSVAFALWSLVQEIEAGGRGLPALRRVASWHAAPLLFFAWWYLFFLRDMEVGGGPQQDLWSVVGLASALLLGLPEASGSTGIAPFLVLLIVGAGGVALYGRGDPRWSFFPAAIIVAPAAVILAADPTYLYFRHFIVCFPFALLLLAFLSGCGWRSRSRIHRGITLAILAMVIAGQVPRNGRLVTLGRGQYTAALRHIVAGTPVGDIRVGSDHDFRNRMLFDFHASRVEGGGRLRYVPRPQWRDTPPDWMITHSLDASRRPDAEIILPGIVTYRLTGQYGFAGTSGWSWFLYRRVD